MNIEKYTTKNVSETEIQFISEGDAGRFEMRISFTLIDAQRDLYNLGFGIWSRYSNQLDDKTELRNGDTNKILATVGQQAIEFLDKNPTSSIVASGSVTPGKLALRTRKYQMGINANHYLLSQRHNIYGFIAEKLNGEFVGLWPRWQGTWEVFDQCTNYDAFLLNLK